MYLVLLTIPAAAGIAFAVLPRAGRAGHAFVAGSVASIGLVAMLFVVLFPNVMPSSTSEAYDLTLANASSTHYTLVVMTIVALVMTPIVLVYQAWTYWVFRYRVGREDMVPTTPLDVLPGARRRGEGEQGGVA